MARRTKRWWLLFPALFAFVSCAPADETTEEYRSIESALTEAQRRTRSQLIIDAANAKGITNPVIVAGIAQAESGLAQCVSERRDRYVCPGPMSDECGGPVIAGYWDGPCSAMQGGLSMWQLDAGNYTQTLAHFGNGIVDSRGATDAAIEFLITEKFLALRNALGGDPPITSRQDVITFLNKAKPGTAEYERYLDLIPGLYNGAWHGRSSLWAGRRAGYKAGIETLLNEFGRHFWQLDDPADGGTVRCGGGDGGDSWQCRTDDQGRAYRERCFASDITDREYCISGCQSDPTSGAVCSDSDVESCARQNLGELWTCDDSGHRWRCISGRTQEQSCRGGCVQTASSLDDVCADAASVPIAANPTCPAGWNATWTCAGNQLRRCLDGTTETRDCAAPSHCVSGSPGRDDTCEMPATSDCPALHYPSIALQTVVAPASVLATYSMISGEACFEMPRCFLDTDNLRDEMGNSVALTAHLSANFTVNEFVHTELAQGYGPYVLLSPSLVASVQRIRELAGTSVRIASGYRSPAHQMATCRSICPGGAACCPSAAHPCGCKSRHSWGDAADLSIPSSQYAAFSRYAMSAGTPDCLIEAGSFHVDMSACALGCPYRF